MTMLERTGQAWKFKAVNLACLVGGALMMLALFDIDGKTTDQFGLLMLSGMTIGMASLVWGCLSIRCPSCGARWLWRAVSTQSAGKWEGWLLSQPKCPYCTTS